MSPPVTLPTPVGFIAHIELVFDGVSPSEIRAHCTIGQHHLQPQGLVHGGLYASLAETTATYGAMINVQQQHPEMIAVGLENHTSFLRAARLGTTILVRATPRHAGRRVQSWFVVMTDKDTDKELATSNVRLLVVEPGSV